MKFSPPSGSVDITTVHFYRKHDVNDPNPILINEDSWKKLGPYAHALPIEDDHKSSSTMLSTLLSIFGTTVIRALRIANRSIETVSSGTDMEILILRVMRSLISHRIDSHNSQVSMKWFTENNRGRWD